MPSSVWSFCPSPCILRDSNELLVVVVVGWLRCSFVLGAGVLRDWADLRPSAFDELPRPWVAGFTNACPNRPVVLRIVVKP